MNVRLSLVERLAAPLDIVDPWALATLWRQACVQVTIQPPEGFSVDDSLPGRVRGALGQTLLQASTDCADATALFELMFDEKADWRRAHPKIPRPFVLFMRSAGRQTRIEIRLFGIATYLAHPLMSYLCRALEGGIAVSERARVRTPIEAVGKLIEQTEGFNVNNEPVRWACLCFHSPVSVMQGKRTFVTAENLVASIIRRISVLAAWQEFALGDSAGTDSLQALDWLVLPKGHARQSWNSGRQRRGGMVMDGERLILIGTGSAGLAEPILKMAEQVHVGARTAFGYGAFRCFMV